MGPIKHLQLGNGYLHSGRFTSAPGLSVHCCCRNTVKKCLPGHVITAYLRRGALSLKPTEVTPIEVKVLEYGFEYQPFQDGNGRIGRLILFKECLRNNIVPFIITDNIKMFYYKGLNEWPHNHERLTDTCLSAQDQMKAVLDYFKIKY